MRMLELYYNFFTSFCDVNKFEELEMDTDPLYVALAEKELEDCIRREMRGEWKRLRSNDCVCSFTADAVANFFPRTCCVKHCGNIVFKKLARSLSKPLLLINRTKIKGTLTEIRKPGQITPVKEDMNHPLTASDQ